MAIKKDTLLKALSDSKTCMDVVYYRRDELGAILVTVGSEAPDTTGTHWIKPQSTADSVTAKKITVGTATPADSTAIWINTNS